MKRGNGLTKRERRACWSHAKKHVIDAVAEAISDEAHSIMTVDGKSVPAMQDQTIEYMDLIHRALRTLRMPK